jgi:carbamoyl-phosphate synthase small subunit
MSSKICYHKNSFYSPYRNPYKEWKFYPIFRMGVSAKLVLEDGTVFHGISFGAESSVSGEVVFNTGMTGYVETLSDPSYKGQILTLTYPLIGNYGVPKEKRNRFGLLENFESDRIQITGLIVADYSKEYSHHAAIKSLGDWLKENNIPAITGIDTRSLTKKLREKGVMLGKIIIGKDIPFDDPNKRNLVAEVSSKKPILYENGKTKIVLIDCGVKNNILNSILKLNVTVLRVPWDYDFTEEDFDGLMISNGPGDPKMCEATIRNIRKTIELKKPIFGVCLGNQLTALAAGADTYKLRYGHRGQNQPCIDIKTKKCYITSQNHGYAVDTKTLPKGWKEGFINANDDTNEGIIHESGLFRTVQFHPEATPGPVDTSYLFEDFIKLVEKRK